MESMFSNCTSIEYIPIYNFNTNKVTNTRYMFYNCSSLKDIILSNFNKVKEVSTKSMFAGCSEELIYKFKELYINFDNEAFEEEDLYAYIECGCTGFPVY